MSFSRPQRPSCGSLRHSRSTSTLTGLNQARRSRNSFQRHPLRSSHSTQCLFPSPSADEEGDLADELQSGVYSTTTTFVQCEDNSGSDSEYSEYDLVNEQMQDFLLDSDNSSQDDDGSGGGDGVLSMHAYCVSGFMSVEPAEVRHSRLRRRTATPTRRRLAKKSESGAALSNAARMTPSSSTTLLSDLDTNMRESVSMMGAVVQLRSRKQRRAAAGDRRWLLPPLTPMFDDDQGHKTLFPLFTVVFDLDETLVGARHGPLLLRPFVGDLLRALHGVPVEIVVWTAGTAHYVNPILHAIGQACGRRQWFHHIISRHRRWYTGANTSVKDLGQLGRSLDRVVMVENNPISILQQPNRCILVEDYLQANPADESLLALKGVLLRLVEACASITSVCARTAGGTSSASLAAPRHPDHNTPGKFDDNPLSREGCGVAAANIAAMLSSDAALQTVEFRMEDVCNEEGVSMNQKVEMRERVGGADTLLCHALRYSPSARSTLRPAQAGLSVSMRSYGCVNPMLPL